MHVFKVSTKQELQEKVKIGEINMKIFQFFGQNHVTNFEKRIVKSGFEFRTSLFYLILFLEFKNFQDVINYKICFALRIPLFWKVILRKINE